MRLGAHMSVSEGKHLAIERGKNIECETIQMFIRNVRGWSSKPLDQKEINTFLEYNLKFKEEIWPIFSHNSYLINLATSDKEKLAKSYEAMLDELIKADQLQLDFVVIHPGTFNYDDENETKKSGLKRITEQINKLFSNTKESNVKILLETVAGQGHNLGRKFHHLETIINGIEDKKRIGVCFDTCHAFASGYDFTTKEKYEEMWDEFDKLIGLNYLYAFHLNDSEKELGSRVDRHIHIGQGKIGKEPFGFFLNDSRFLELPGVLETPKGNDMKEDIMNLATLRSLIKS
ncbi:MAG: deoxyribonuclease IV [Candidatus Lokiarchaeota archaeon]|nr:deoxyribonuclease IV [Candidatus Lokiarchaeota archaeon]